MRKGFALAAAAVVVVAAAAAAVVCSQTVLYRACSRPVQLVAAEDFPSGATAAPVLQQLTVKWHACV